MLSLQDEQRLDKVATATAAAKKKLHKYQQKSKKVVMDLQDHYLEQENIGLKEKLFKAREQMEWMDHEIRTLREKNSELQRLFTSDFLSDSGESIIFPDHHTLEAYEREERTIFENMKKKLHELKERYRNDSAELCSHCMGQLIDI